MTFRKHVSEVSFIIQLWSYLLLINPRTGDFLIGKPAMDEDSLTSFCIHSLSRGNNKIECTRSQNAYIVFSRKRCMKTWYDFMNKIYNMIGGNTHLHVDSYAADDCVGCWREPAIYTSRILSTNPTPHPLGAGLSFASYPANSQVCLGFSTFLRASSVIAPLTSEIPQTWQHSLVILLFPPGSVSLLQHLHVSMICV